MSKLRMLWMVSAVALIAVGFALAQGAGGPPAGGGRGLGAGANVMGAGAGQIAQILNQLELTDDQKQKIDKLRADFETRLKDMTEKMRTAQEDLRKFREENPNDQEGFQKKRQEMNQQMAPMRDAIQGFVEQVKAQLNEDQVKKFDQIMADRGGPMGMGAGPGGRMGMQGAMGLPGLDPKTQQDLNLTDQQKENMRGLQQAYQEEQRQLLDKYIGLIKDMLTPEQQDKFEKIVAEMKNRPGNRPGMGARGPRGARAGGAGPENPPPHPEGADAPPEKPAD
jgi:Spy/CpxP family protein refolding chaperone